MCERVRERESPHLLWCTADEGFGVQQGIQLAQDGGKIGISFDPSQQVIVTPFLFDHCGSLL